MKKLLVLGGAKAQVPLIQAAKREGYYVVLCDWTTTNPGIALCDKHYQVSTLDLDAVFRVADIEKPDGVVSNSEPAMYNVAACAEHCGVVGNPKEAIEILQSKCGFRHFQKKAGLYCPTAFETDNLKEAVCQLRELHFPIVVKPSESSGSRGTTVLKQYNAEQFAQAFVQCSKFSVHDKVTVEEYVPMPTLKNIEGDIFVHNGIILWHGLMTTLRSVTLPFVPDVSYLPINESEDDLQIIKKNMESIVHQLGIRHGEYNVEAFFTEEKEFFVIEINARQGGNALPSLVQDSSGVDMSRLLVTTAVGEDAYFNAVAQSKLPEIPITQFLVFSHKTGNYRGLFIDPSILDRVYQNTSFVAPDMPIDAGENASDVLARLRLRFSSAEEQVDVAERLDELIYPVVE